MAAYEFVNGKCVNYNLDKENVTIKVNNGKGTEYHIYIRSNDDQKHSGFNVKIQRFS